MSQGKFEFSIKERLFLANQYLILEKLYPERASDYARRREAISRGYMLDYGWIAGEIDQDEMSVEECREVINILDMHRSLLLSCQSARVDPKGVRFEGFDKNQERRQYGYASYLLAVEGKWNELKKPGDDYSSDHPTLERYRAMLRRWLTINYPRRFNLTRQQIEEILTPPD